jgi:hypothetical protein
VSLARALSRLPGDSHTEHVLRDVLSLFDKHQSEWLSESEVECRTARSSGDVHLVLPALSAAYVLDFDSTSGRYRYVGDTALGFEIDMFMRRVRSYQSHQQTNVAKFRERYGS